MTPSEPPQTSGARAVVAQAAADERAQRGCRAPALRRRVAGETRAGGRARACGAALMTPLAAS